MIILGPKTGKTIFLVSMREKTVAIDKHNHIAIVDAWGDGKTSIDAGHRHNVFDGVVQRIAGHGHERAAPRMPRTSGERLDSVKCGLAYLPRCRPVRESQ